jgi:hypothetical protein
LSIAYKQQEHEQWRKPVAPARPGAVAIALEQTSAKQKQNITGDSQEITQPSTNPAQTGLSCEF